MSLGTSLYTTITGLKTTESRLDAVSSNVTNADKAGYTRKEYQSNYVTTSSGTVPTGGSIETLAYDQYLYNAMREDSSDVAYFEIISDYLSKYSASLGSTSDSSTISSSLDNLITTIEALTQTPEDTSLKSTIVSAAEMLTYELRTLSSSVQELRADVDEQIEVLVTEANTALEQIEVLNKQIARAEVMGTSTANLEDERRTALEALSSVIDVEYYINSDNQMSVFLGGRSLITSTSGATLLSYNSTSIVDSTVVYPGGFDNVDLNGVDITTELSKSALGALIELRDTILVDEQLKLDEYATTLMDEMNTLMNQGASLPARDTIVGEEVPPVAFISSGSVRIATVDSAGTIANVVDLNLAGSTSIGDIVLLINGSAIGADVTASVTANGELQLVANNAGEGISINESTSSIGVDAEGFAKFFGLNNMFDGTDASDIYVSDYLRTSSEYMVTTQLSLTAVVGEVGVGIGSASQIEAISDLFDTAVSFSAAGDFAAQNVTLSTYVGKVMSAIATEASSAKTLYETAHDAYETTVSNYENLTGVNVDEEMAMMVELQSQYEAAATLLNAIQEMFDQLMSAVN